MIVEPNVVKRVALRAQGAVVAAAFGLSFFAVADAAEAETLARRRLAGDTAAHAAD